MDRGGPGQCPYIFHPTEQNTVYCSHGGLPRDSNKSANRLQINPPSHFSPHLADGNVMLARADTGDGWLVCSFSLDTQTQHNTAYIHCSAGQFAVAFSKCLMYPFRRGSAHTIRNQTLGTMLRPAKQNTRRLAT